MNAAGQTTREPTRTERATFAAGCFWHVEEAFRALPGVVSTHVGYTGGIVEHPTYEDVCGDETGHAEAVEITYDPKSISYNDLLDTFWKTHDPTQVNRQGPDVGSQYRSVIFFHSSEQQELALQSKDALEHSGKYHNPVATEIVPAPPFYEAEEYHQKYLARRGLTTCPI